MSDFTKQQGAVLSLLLLFVSLSPVEAYDLYLKARVFVQGDVVRLRELGEIKNGARAETVGEKVVVSRLKRPVYLSARELRGRLSVGPEKAGWIYGGGVWLIPVGPPMQPAEVVDLLRAQIAAREGGRKLLESTRFRIEGTAQLPAATEGTGLEFQLPRQIDKLRPGRNSLVLSLVARQPKKGRKGALHRYRVEFLVSGKISVALAARDLRSRERLQPGDWHVEERWSEEANTDYAPTELTNYSVLTPLKSGTVLLDSMVKKIPAVIRGQSLSLLYKRPGLELKCPSIALQKGNIGDVIGVRIVWPSGNSSRIVRVRVVGEGLAVPDV